METLSAEEVYGRISEIEKQIRELNAILVEKRANNEGEVAIENFYYNLKEGFIEDMTGYYGNLDGKWCWE
jgi:hypothetical protein